jgi:peroxiredoxin Q/BCP
MNKVTEKKKAPQFSLPDKDGAMHSLQEWKDNYIVLYFYPKDDTPGCTIEALEFTGNVKQFAKLGARVVGISGGDEKSKASFCRKHNLKILLLSDSDFTVAKKYESYGVKTFMGRKYTGILRSTFVLDPDHKILKRYDAVSAKGHAEEVLNFIKSLSARPQKGEGKRKAPGAARSQGTRKAKVTKRKK